jgi:hypothetical protein
MSTSLALILNPMQNYASGVALIWRMIFIDARPCASGIRLLKSSLFGVAGLTDKLSLP